MNIERIQFAYLLHVLEAVGLVYRRYQALIVNVGCVLIFSGVGYASLQAVEINRILCYGDSITHHGKWLREVSNTTGIELINAGRAGRKVSQASEELTPYLEKHQNIDCIVIVLGVNDLPARDPRPGTVKVDLCVKEMAKVIDQAVKAVPQPKSVILVAPPGVNPELMNKTNLTKGYHICQPLLEQLEEGYQKLADEKKVSFMSLLTVVSQENFKDGLHPNKDGDLEIARRFIDFFNSM